MLECITPGADEILLPKTSSSVFQSTSLDYLLRNLGVRQLVLCGCVTGGLGLVCQGALWLAGRSPAVPLLSSRCQWQCWAAAADRATTPASQPASHPQQPATRPGRCPADQCVEHAVRDACDLGYLVTLATDACATYSQQRQEASLAAVGGYCRQRTTAQLLAELAAVGCGGSAAQPARPAS